MPAQVWGFTRLLTSLYSEWWIKLDWVALMYWSRRGWWEQLWGCRWICLWDNRGNGMFKLVKGTSAETGTCSLLLICFIFRSQWSLCFLRINQSVNCRFTIVLIKNGLVWLDLIWGNVTDASTVCLSSALPSETEQQAQRSSSPEVVLEFSLWASTMTKISHSSDKCLLFRRSWWKKPRHSSKRSIWGTSAQVIPGGTPPFRIHKCSSDRLLN